MLSQSDVHLPKISIIKTDSFDHTGENDNYSELLNDAIIANQSRNVVRCLKNLFNKLLFYFKKRYRKLSQFEDEFNDDQNKILNRSRSTRTRNQSRRQSLMNNIFLRPRAKSICKNFF